MQQQNQLWDPFAAIAQDGPTPVLGLSWQARTVAVLVALFCVFAGVLRAVCKIACKAGGSVYGHVVALEADHVRHRGALKRSVEEWRKGTSGFLLRG